MDVWLQRHDFTTDDLSDRSRDECLALLASHDWASELARYEAALADNRARCPPGMGFVDAGRTLHIMPVHGGRSHYHYSSDHPVRLFALFGANRSLNVWNIPDQHRANLLSLHYDRHEQDLVRSLHTLDTPATSG
jgi:hypothetical protein